MTIDREEMTASSSEEAVNNAMLDYKTFLGKPVMPTIISGYRGDDQIDVQVDGKVIVKVVETSADDIAHWNDDFLDPYWNIEIIDDPQGLCEGLRSAWIFGRSYQVK